MLCSDSSTKAKKIQKNYQKEDKRKKIMCHVSPVTCHQRQQSQPQTLPLLTPPLFSVGWFTPTEPTTHFFLLQTQKMVQTFNKNRGLSFPILAIHSLTRSLQLSRFLSPTEGTTLLSCSTNI